jgi:leucyl-tRNA synthetase
VKGAPPQEAVEVFLKLLAPIAPFITEELWHRLGHDGSIHLEAWPTYDPAVLAAERVTMVVQVNGKVRDTMEVAADVARDEMEALALGSDKVRRALDGRTPSKTIVVPPRLVNLVLS